MSEEKKKRRISKDPDLRTLEPGTKIMMGKILRKVPWTKSKVEERYPMVTFIPEFSDVLLWNGVRYVIIEGVECSIPKPHHEMYLERQRFEHKPKSAAIIVGGQAISVQYGAGLAGFPGETERGRITAESLARSEKE